MNIVNKIAVFLLAFILMPVMNVSVADDEAVSDIRVLIDVSGSMKKNDPENLRAPALRMLAGIMPEEAKSGVWTFAKFVNMLVPWRDVDDTWRSQAEARSKQIHSYGLFTNLEQVLKKSTANIRKVDSRYKRSVILLSDGFVDIQPDDKASAASRKRIFDQIIPSLKKANITVHTIALSGNADHELLKALSFATDGWYQRADSGDDLQRIFLHMFEKAAQRDTLPLKDNQFTVDASVAEMTVLAFRASSAESTRLVMPDGSIKTPDNQSSSLRWLHEQSYDLITIDKPMAGKWVIDAELDPDNRVMVVTDMKLKTTDLPNNVLVGEKFDFEALLTEKGETITRIDFLNLVEASLQQDNEGEQSYIGIDRGLKESVFRASISDLKAGANDIVLTLKSETFQRQRRQSINVVAMPFTIEQTQLETQNRSHRFTVQANTALIKPESVTITSLLQAKDGSEWPYDMLKTDDNHWQLTLTDLEQSQSYELSLQIKAETQKGRAVFLQPETIALLDMQDLDETLMTETPGLDNQVDEEKTELLIDTQTKDEDEFILIDDTATADDFFTDDDTSSSSISETTALLIGNGIILMLLVGGIVWWRSQSKALMQAGDLL